MRTVRWLMLSVLLALPLFGQETNLGGIAGTVRDPTGALVAGAHATALNEGTGASFEAITNSMGGYTFTKLPVGAYSVSVAATGFAKTNRTNVRVISGQSFTVDFTLAVGLATQT